MVCQPNPSTALLLIAFLLLEAILSWRAIGREERPADDPILIAVLLLALPMLARLMVVFRCTRERIVLGLLMLRSALSLAAKMMPSLVADSFRVFSVVNLVLWILALLVSGTMLYSSLYAAQLRRCAG